MLGRIVPVSYMGYIFDRYDHFYKSTKLNFYPVFFLSEYKTDPYSEGNACNTICCRGDLLTKGAKPDGCYDTKVSLSYFGIHDSNS